MAGGAWCAVAEGYGKARTSVDRALAIEPDLAEGLAMRGMIQMHYDFDLRGAAASLHRALELAPGSPLALHLAGLLELNHGRAESAIALYRRALDGDPLGAGTYHNLGNAQVLAERFVEAEESYRKALELAPQRSATRALLAVALHAMGRAEDALAEADREPNDAWRLYARAIICHDLGRTADSDDAYRELTTAFAADSAYQIAEVHGARGEVDEAFAWLERARAQRDGGLATLMGARALRSLHGDPRWRALTKTLGVESGT
jgi:tetratricopeptide (TPR) repeat protein